MMNKNIVMNVWIAGGLLAGMLVSGCAPVTVSSTSGEANVYYKNSNKLIGSTPVKLNVGTTEKEVVVRKEGYFSKTVVLSPVGRGRVYVELDRREKVFLTSQPSGAKLYVSGTTNSVGRTPYAIDYDNPCRVFAVCSPGYAHQIVRIPEDPEGNVVVDLERIPTVMVVSQQKNVGIYNQAGRKLGVAPLAVPSAKKGTFVLQKEGYYAKNITIKPDSVRHVAVRLEPKPYITVKSNPVGAEVYRSGGKELVGKTPVEIFVEKDTEFEVRMAGYNIKSFKLSAHSNNEITVPLEQSLASLEKNVLNENDPSDLTNPIVFALAKDESVRNIALSDSLLNTPSSF